MSGACTARPPPSPPLRRPRAAYPTQRRRSGRSPARRAPRDRAAAPRAGAATALPGPLSLPDRAMRLEDPACSCCASLARPQQRSWGEGPG
eukprot:scaffold62156_cov40-Phaeocystis_antarctica.AAC.1